MKMKIKFTTTSSETKEVEKELENPTYTKRENDYYKIFENENEVMVQSVWIMGTVGSVHLSIRPFRFSPEAATAQPSTEQEFNQMLEQALKALGFIGLIGTPEEVTA